eukprot:6250374-Alexandrium_andersonii.AAC.1
MAAKFGDACVAATATSFVELQHFAIHCQSPPAAQTDGPVSVVYAWHARSFLYLGSACTFRASKRHASEVTCRWLEHETE